VAIVEVGAVPAPAGPVSAGPASLRDG
jgi:hypothetical protein